MASLDRQVTQNGPGVINAITRGIYNDVAEVTVCVDDERRCCRCRPIPNWTKHLRKRKNHTSKSQGQKSNGGSGDAVVVAEVLVEKVMRKRKWWRLMKKQLSLNSRNTLGDSNHYSNNHECDGEQKWVRLRKLVMADLSRLEWAPSKNTMNTGKSGEKSQGETLKTMSNHTSTRQSNTQDPQGLPAAADQLPDLIRSHGKPVSHPQLTLLIRLHTAARRPLRALYTLRRFRHDFSVQPQVHVCNRVLGALTAAGHVEDALKLFDEMAESGIRPMPVTFAIIVRALGQEGMAERILEMIGRMRDEVCRPDVFVYTALVKTMVRRGHMEACIRVWEEMGRDGVEPDTMAYATMVEGLCNAGMVEKAAKLFEGMRKKGLLVHRIVYASLVDGYVAAGRVGDGCRILKEMVDAGYRADLKTYNILIGGLCGIGREDKAHQMFQIVLQEELVPSSETVSQLLVCYADKGEMVNFFGLVDKLVELSLPAVEFLADFLRLFACKGGRELKAVELFKTLRQKGYCSVNIYNILIENLLKIKERKKALLLFEEMKASDDCEPESCTYSLMIPCFVDEGNIEEACSCYNSMMKAEWIPSLSAYRSLVKGLCKIGDINAAVSLVSDCLGNVENGPMEFKYTLTVIEACRSKDPEKVMKVVVEMIELGYLIEELIFSAVIYGFCKYATSTGAREVFSVMRDRDIISEADFIVYEDMLNEHLKKVTADLVISGLKFFNLESKLKWRSRID
uniref:Pentacotripeptide-repeat region of PRORP domain-containing protein n=1 Tax=Aegilops tauschii TaxID=37682 RepID=M8CPH5_AEGTA